MKVMAAVAVGLLALPAWAANEFQEGCKQAATEVLCVGHQDCVIDAILDRSSTGNDSEKAGRAECTKLAKKALSKGISAEGKAALGRLKKGLAKLNKELAKDFPFLKVTADFKRLELEDLVRNARAMGRSDRGRERSIIVGLSSSETSESFETHYLKPIRTAVSNAAQDDLGVAFLKEKISEIRLGFCTHGWTASSPTLKVVDRVLIIPGIYSEDSTGYATGVQAFIEKMM